MKKALTLCLVLFTFMAAVFSGCNSKKDGLTKVRLNEVAHSIFYAPQYVAIELGYFEEEGIDLDLTTGFGADKTMTAVLTNAADIGFMGSESSIYTYAEGANDYPVNFAQLTQRAGNFLVSRTPIDNFEWKDVMNTTVLGGRTGGMPEMIFEYILKKNGINPDKDLSIVKNIDFGLTAGAFSSGKGDFTVEFEPGATSLELEGQGYVVASLGVDSGFVPYTAYCAKQSYLNDNPEIINAFIRAIEKGLNYVATHTPEEIAKVIAPQFKDTDVSTIAIIVERYQTQNTWKTDTRFEKESFELLVDILMDAGELDSRVPYEELVVIPE